jgi:transposase
MKSATERGSVQMQITTIGLDLAKSVFQVHGVDAGGKPGIAHALLRSCSPV